MGLFKTKKDKKLDKLLENILKAHKIVNENPQRAELVLAIMNSTNVRADDITVAEAHAILVTYYVNGSIGGLTDTQKEEIWAAIIAVVLNAESDKEVSSNRAKDLAKRCDILFADILKKQAGLT